MSPDFPPPAEMRFFSREKGKTDFLKEKPSTKSVFPFSHGKNRISQGVENRGSLISVPFALTVFFVFGTLSVTFWSLFVMLLSLFSSLFCQTPFAGLLLRQGDGSVVVEFGVFGAPRFSVQRSQNTCFKGFGDLRTENRGAPKRPFQPRRIQPPILGPLTFSQCHQETQAINRSHLLLGQNERQEVFLTLER